MTGATVTAEAGSATVFGHTVSNLQDDVSVSKNAITGTLFYTDEGTLAHDWGAGYFIVLHFADWDQTVTSVKVGLGPSSGTGLVEVINDPDHNGVFKITDKDKQVFQVVVTDGTKTTTQSFDLSGLRYAQPEA